MCGIFCTSVTGISSDMDMIFLYSTVQSEHPIGSLEWWVSCIPFEKEAMRYNIQTSVHAGQGLVIMRYKFFRGAFAAHPSKKTVVMV